MGWPGSILELSSFSESQLMKEDVSAPSPVPPPPIQITAEHLEEEAIGNVAIRRQQNTGSFESAQSKIMHFSLSTRLYPSSRQCQ